MKSKKQQQAPMTLLRTGTDNQPVAHASHNTYAPQHGQATDYGSLDTPAVWRSSRETAASHVQALQEKGVDTYDIQALLRKQAD